MELKQRSIQNVPIKSLVQWLDMLDGIKLPVIDETGYKENIDISFNFKDFFVLRNTLKAYGLDLIEVERELDVFIISEK